MTKVVDGWRLEDMPEVLDVDQARHILRVSLPAFNELCESGQIRTLQYNRATRLVWKAEILRVLAEQSGHEWSGAAS